MEKIKFIEEKVIQEENEYPIGLIVLKKGDLLCQSYFCDYRKIYINKGIFSEEFLFQLKNNEFLKNINEFFSKIISYKIATLRPDGILHFR
ncbi:hypothetical protein X275_07330 [Marinitoga sp. 1197]|uniref:hypothetical protein n=1 Tax=Marinitoga sp. 1197 TaxID=1428449 RepID=UPI000640EBBD|nr:hypothetical protein [Marinitoga sp. 1197]KLO22123.1 hypothetical protein X275_07330 [Marinitoga sp. 1197]